MKFLVEKAVLAVIHHADNLTFRGRPHDEALANSRGRPKQLVSRGSRENQFPCPILSNTFDDAGPQTRSQRYRGVFRSRSCLTLLPVPAMHRSPGRCALSRKLKGSKAFCRLRIGCGLHRLHRRVIEAWRGSVHFVFRGTGHINPMTALARRLQQRGHEVVFFGIPDIEARVRAAGVDFCRIGESDYPPGTLLET